MESLSLSPADRLRMLETNNNLLRERLSLLAQNLVDAHRQQHQHLRSLEEEIKELKASSSELKLTFNHLSQEVNQFARKDQLRVLEKYLDLWNPVKFITQKELEDALMATTKLPATTPATHNHNATAMLSTRKRGVHHRNPTKAKTHAK